MQKIKRDEIVPLVDYPLEIRGSLRLVLQIKDVFIAAFNTLEEYRRCLLACQRGFYRGLAVYNLTVGLSGINQLRCELDEVERRVQAKVTQNKVLRHYLKKQYMSNNSIQSPQGIRAVEFLSGITIPSKRIRRKDGLFKGCDTGENLIHQTSAVDVALHGGLELSTLGVNIDNLKVPQEVNLGSAKTKTGQTLLPVVEFYRGFFFLQMHFQITMCLAANYTMPFITQPVGLCKRVRGWPEEPNYPGKAGNTADRLHDINIELTNLLNRLQACVDLVHKKIAQDDVIETYYRQNLAAQEKTSRKLLHCIQAQRRYGEDLDGQNDRLTGLATKLDKNFPRIAKFHTFTGPEGIFELVDSITESDTHEMTSESHNNSPIIFDEDRQARPGRDSSRSSVALLESVRESQRIHGDSTFATEAIPLSESVNQLLLGSDSIAPGVSSKEKSGIDAHQIPEIKQYSTIEEVKSWPRESVDSRVNDNKKQAGTVSESKLIEPPKLPIEPVPSTFQDHPQILPIDPQIDKTAIPEISVAIPDAEQEENTADLTTTNTEDQKRDDNQSANSNHSDYDEEIDRNKQLIINTENLTVLSNTERKSQSRSPSRSPHTKSSRSTGRKKTSRRNGDELKNGGQNVSNVNDYERTSSNSREYKESSCSSNEISLFDKKCKLPDINENNNSQIAYQSSSRELITRRMVGRRHGPYQSQSMRIHDYSNSKNTYSRETRWRTADDNTKEYNHNVNIVSDVNCVPQWIKVAMNKPAYAMSEEELCCDHQRGWTSKSTLEKRQIMIERILKADGDRLQRMLATILKS